MSLRDQLERKTPRRCVVPIPVSDQGPARRRLDEATAALAAVALAPEVEGALEGLRADVDAAQAELDATVADVALQAPPAAAAEELLAQHLDVDGTPDYDACLPELLALCAEDEGLQDAGWWRDQLARPVWGRAEVAGLRLGVLYLVADPIRPLVPKG